MARSREADEYNARVIEEFRASGGRLGGAWAGTPLVLIHHVGARSGVEHVTPLVPSLRDDRGFLLVAAAGGAPKHPGWYHNLKANPRITVEAAGETYPALAEELDGAAREDAWSRVVAESPQVAEYQGRVSRRLPLFRVTRLD